MPIPVTCPECQYHFLVGDEFAGRPGRCPECSALIHVPGAEPRGESRPRPADDEPRHPDPYDAPRTADAFDDFPSRVRRRRRDDDSDRDQQDDYHDRDQFGEYDDRDRDRHERRGRTFDPVARAARWESTASGLRNLMIAVILMTSAQVVASVFDLVEPVQPGQQNVLTERDKVMMVGNGVFVVLALLLWGYGRIGCGRVPYVPARRIALPAGVIAGLTAVLGVCALGAMVAGAFLIAQNPAGPGGGLFLLGGCAFVPVLVAFPVAELMGLVSQVKMATGLRDPAFARASRVQIVVGLVLTGLFFAGLCGLFIFAAAQAQKAQKQQQAGPPPVVKQGAPGKAAKGKDQAKAAAPGDDGPNAQQQPPPEFDIGEHPEIVYGAAVGRLFIFLTYAVVAVIAFQLGRRAIRREIEHLTGDPHDRPPDDRY